MCGYALTVTELVHGPEVQQEYMGVKVQANTRGIYNGEGWTMSLQSRWDSWVLQIISLGCKRDYGMHCSNTGTEPGASRRGVCVQG